MALNRNIFIILFCITKAVAQAQGLGDTSFLTTHTADTNWKQTSTGLKYRIFSANTGRKPVYGDMIYYDIFVSNAKDSLIQSSFDTPDTAMMFLQEPPFKGSIEEGIILMSEGDSAKFLIPVDSIVDVNNVPYFLQLGTMLNITLKLYKVKSAEQFNAEQKAKKNKQKAIDEAKIAAYVKKQNLSYVRDTSGLYIIKTKKAGGKLITKYDTVIVHYKGYTLNGVLFDNSRERNIPFQFVIGIGSVIQGWEIGLMYLKPGEKATIIIPSGLAYGTQGTGEVIGPNTIIAFDVEIIAVTKAK